MTHSSCHQYILLPFSSLNCCIEISEFINSHRGLLRVMDIINFLFLIETEIIVNGFSDLNEAQVFLKGIKAFDDAQIEALFKKYDADGNGLLDREGKS